MTDQEQIGINSPAPALYMIPVPISDAPVAWSIPPANMVIIRGIKHFVVENLRTARRWIKKICPDSVINELEFTELNEHTDQAAVGAMLAPLRNGEPIGVMSEAGCPGVADPGADIVACAQAEGFRVVPLVGPSSILMALMGSGFNGQGFAFHGYLPVAEKERNRAIKRLENAAATGVTQIFIETPYRNSRMLSALLAVLRPDTMLCIATAISDPAAENIRSMRADRWQRCQNLPKQPTVFLIHRYE